MKSSTGAQLIDRQASLENFQDMSRQKGAMVINVTTMAPIADRVIYMHMMLVSWCGDQIQHPQITVWSTSMIQRKPIEDLIQSLRPKGTFFIHSTFDDVGFSSCPVGLKVTSPTMEATANVWFLITAQTFDLVMSNYGLIKQTLIQNR